MAYLDWIGKKAVVEHHQHVPLLTFEENSNKTMIDIEENILIRGDNLCALKSLLPYYSRRVKCIYIDPPYNTGNENWKYNDNVNSPEIAEWLGKVVGKDAVDLSRHDKWLCMMYPRLILAKEMLSDDGIIFISIDDNEYHRLTYLMEEIFEHKNLFANFIWQTEGNFDNQAKVKLNHEYIVAYCRDITKFPPPPIIDPNTKEGSKLFKQFIRNTIVKNGPKNPISEVTIPIGFPADFKNGKIEKRDNAWPHYDRDLIVKDYKTINEVVVSSGWSSKKIFTDFIDSKFRPVTDTKRQSTTFVITKTGAIEAIKNRKDDQSHVVSVLRGFGSTQQASTFLENIGIEFDYPKPVDLIKYLLSMNRGNNYIVMDFFGGSGTTAQSVIELNELDDGNRKFVLVEWDKHIFEDICLKRVNFVSEKKGISYRTLELGSRVFDEFGLFNKELSWKDIARYLFFNETRNVINVETCNEDSGFIGSLADKSIFLYYNTSNPASSNILEYENLKQLRKYNGQKVVYAIACTISTEKLSSENIVFKQIPYESGGRK